jgi:hypothetical protein
MLMSECERNEVCILEFNNIKERVDRMEELALKRDDDMKVIEKAIVAIQVANEQTAKTLEKMDVKMDAKIKRTPFWDEKTKKTAMRYGLIAILALILALVGTNMIEGLQVINGIT